MNDHFHPNFGGVNLSKLFLSKNTIILNFENSLKAGLALKQQGGLGSKKFDKLTAPKLVIDDTSNMIFKSFSYKVVKMEPFLGGQMLRFHNFKVKIFENHLENTTNDRFDPNFGGVNLSNFFDPRPPY